MTTIVFLPGLHNDSLVWDPVRRALPERFETVSADLPAVPDLDALVDSVAEQVPPASVVVGHSFGGVVAMRLAERHPSLVAGLALVNSPDDAEDADSAAQRVQRAADLSDEQYEQLAVGRMNLVFHGERADDPAVREERLRGARAYGPQRFAAHAVALGQRPDRAQFLAGLDVPVLVVTAEHDQVVPTERQREWARSNDVEYVEVPDTAHMLPSEEPGLVADAISDWWRRAEAGRGLVATALPEGPLPDYEVAGSGDTTLFLLHGAYGDRYYFEDSIRRWTDAGLRVVAWTCPGYGAGEEVPAGYGVPLLAEYAARLVLAEKTRHNILLGHSMGGLIGPRVPALVGDALDGLILSAASPGFTNRTEEDKAKYLEERVEPITKGGLTVPEYATGLLTSMMAPGASGAQVDKVFEVVSAMRTEAFLASMQAITEYNSVPSLKTLSLPTIMLPGTHDPACKAEGMRRMRDMVDAARYHEFADAGHYAFAESPAEYHEVTMSFIREVVPASGAEEGQ